MLFSDDRLDNSIGLNVIIPIGGIGSRFQKEGYIYPKPFINIVGRPMLYWVIEKLSLTPADTLWIAISDEIATSFQVDGQLKKEFPNINIKLVPLCFNTCGAAETLFIVCQSMNFSELSQRTISIDCDTIYVADILSMVRVLPKQVSACLYFTDDSDKPIFSYISLDENSRIIDIKEKLPISKNANTGCYVFSSAYLLKEQAETVLSLQLSEGFTGEFFTSAIISSMIKLNYQFVGIPIDPSEFHCVGTPLQLEAFLISIRDDPNFKLKRRFCFDLDGTLVSLPEIPGDYSTVKPIPENILLAQELHKAGHHIIIQTARRMKTHKGNVGAVLKDVAEITFRTLSEFEVPFDEICFGKPYADIYVDDLAVNALLNVKKDLGWVSLTSKKVPKDMVESRDINTVQVFDGLIIKSSSHEDILGEIYFYCNMPSDCSSFFAKLCGKPEYSQNSYSIRLEKIIGVSFAHLLVGRALTRGKLVKYMEALYAIHQSDGVCLSPVALDPIMKEKVVSIQGCSSVYANYSKKLRSRVAKYWDSIYSTLGPEFTDVYQQVMEWLEAYEDEDRAIRAKVIHGDPVFSNAVLQGGGEIKFFDMRGSLGGVLSIEGDCLYDLSKLYQCLFGYDFFLFPVKSSTNSEIPSKQDALILKDLRDVFHDFVFRKYGDILDDVKHITASLYLSLLPYHPENRWFHFFTVAKQILRS